MTKVYSRLAAHTAAFKFSGSGNMLNVINSKGVNANGSNMYPEGNGVLINKQQFTNIIKAFKTGGYKPYEQIDNLWL